MDQRDVFEALGLSAPEPISVEDAENVVAEAWKYSGRYFNYTTKPSWSATQRIWLKAPPFQRFYVVAVATMQARGQYATPAAVAKLVGNARSTMVRKLRWLAGGPHPWWSDQGTFEWSPLTRHKHGRTHYYTVNKNPEHGGGDA